MSTEVHTPARLSWRRFIARHIRKGLQQALLRLGILGMALNWAGSTQAATNPDTSTASICKAAASYAAKATGTPLSVLLAISLTETGRKRGGGFEPWPWTVNMEGKGKWFSNRAEAHEYVVENHKRGARSFDVGCFQINYKWHGAAFSSISQMFEPRANALYAGQLLAKLFREMGNWEAAAGAYHSRTPKYANRYKKRFARIHASLTGIAELPSVAPAAKTSAPNLPKPNRYPLLQSGAAAAASRGSLVKLLVTDAPQGLIRRQSTRLF